ncbi:MAG: sodium:proton antiporter [Parasporobacterium sp.]|nr:sodium:proton antiporter [Parasporobacterium sp.]
MELYQNIPFFSIFLAMFSGTVSSVLPGKAARTLNTIVISVIMAASAILTVILYGQGTSYTFMMGHFPAPWGNEIRAGVLEAGMAFFFCVIMLLSMLGGRKKLDEEVEETKHNLYYVLVNLLLSSLLAMVYTNDLFTAYVFVEINTIAACGLIMIRQIGRTIEAAVRYMILSLLGSGLFLVGLVLLYDLTGHLLMSNIQEAVAKIIANGEYTVPLLVSISLMSAGLAIKSALFPFHAWLPDAYGYSTVSSASLLSSLVSKGYIFLLIKIFYRVIGIDYIRSSDLIDVLFIFGLSGMIFGSLSAIRENDIRRMIASVFHILMHGATKSLLFTSAIGLTDVSGYSRQFIQITGAGYRNKIAGVGFTVGALSMVGFPCFSGFISKLLFAQAALQNTAGKMLPALIVLGISTILNAIYFMKTVIRIYTPVPDSDYPTQHIKDQKLYSAVIVAFVTVNLILGLTSVFIEEWISRGLRVFG